MVEDNGWKGGAGVMLLEDNVRLLEEKDRRLEG